MGYINIIISILLLSNVMAITSLKELTSKQNILNLRYLNQQTQLTIYKKTPKELMLSTNFKATPILKVDVDSDFIVKRVNEDYFIIWQIPYHHDLLSPMKEGVIYTYNMRLNIVKKLDTGAIPKVHHPKNIISYYNSSKGAISIYNVEDNIRVATLKINTNRNYFIPMISIHKNDIFYSDINDKGKIGLIHLNLATKERKILYKPTRRTSYFESCLMKDKIVFLESSKEEPFTSIFSLKLSEINFEKRTIHISSTTGPSHHLTCEERFDSVFFVTQFEGKTRINSEVGQLNLSNNSLVARSDLKFVTSITKMADKIVIPYRKYIYTIHNSQGVFFVGENQKEKK